MSFNWYIAGSGKNQKMYDFLSERIPTIGYTDNKDVNLFVAARSPDDYRYGRREEALNLLERELDRVMEYLEDKYLGFASYELWFNERTGSFYSSLARSESASTTSGWRREIFGSEEDMIKWLQGKEDIWRKHQALMGHLEKAKEALREFGAEEDVKLLDKVITNLSEA